MRLSVVAFFGFALLALASACGGHGSPVTSSLGHVGHHITTVRHVPTQDNGDPAALGGHDYPSPAVLLTWAYIATPGNISKFQLLGVKVMFYTMETRVADSSGIQEQYYDDLGTPAPGNPNYAKDCNNQPLSNQTTGLSLTQPDYASVESTYKTDWLDPTATATPDAYFFDAAGNFGDMPSAPCKSGTTTYTEPEWIASPVAAAIATMAPRSVVYNGLTFVSSSSTSPAPEIALNGVSNVIGGRAEECYIRTGASSSYDGVNVWQAFENTELKMIAANKYVVCQPNDVNVDPSTADGLAHRMFAYASFLLTYDTSNTYAIYWYYPKAGTSGTRVMPETQVVPQNPTTPQPTNVSTLSVGTNVYAREYQHCYVFGSEVGTGCLVIVNVDPSTAQALPSGYTSYSNSGHHRLVLHGGAWADGGWITEDGSPAPTSMPADSGFVVFDNPTP
jgi:hypothetical protein